MAKLSVDQALLKAKSHAKKGDIEEAKKLYQSVLQSFPKNKRAQQGLAALNKPKQPAATQGPPQETISQLINLNNQGQLGAVVEQAQALTEQYPEAFIIWKILGVANKGLGRVQAASEAFKKVTELNPTYADGFNNLGVTLKDQGKLEEAIEAYNKALSLKPDYANAYYNMGNTLKEQGKLDEAIEAYNKALSLKPDYANAYNNMGNALQDQGKLDEAIEAYNKALAIKPDYAEAYDNIGTALKDQGKLEEAIASYNKALSLKPDYAEAHENLSFALLNIGKFKEGLDEYEWRQKTKKHLRSMRPFPQPMWDGQKSLRGKKILIWCEQGVGDTIRWSSCLSFIASQAEHCILECQEKLVPLLVRSFPNVEVKPENRNLDLVRDDFDVHLPMGSLYRHFISKISLDGKADAFLIPDPIRVNYWRERLSSLGNGPYVGISWKSSNMSPKRLLNYALISELSPVLLIPEVTFINLQPKDFEGDLSKIQNEFGVTVHNFDDLDHYDNLDEVAALSSALDIVLSTHNAVPILTAGIGTITKLASWQQSSWNNPLYSPHGPSIDTFQRNTWEPWDNVFSLIAKDIMSYIQR